MFIKHEVYIPVN